MFLPMVFYELSHNLSTFKNQHSLIRPPSSMRTKNVCRWYLCTLQRHHWVYNRRQFVVWEAFKLDWRKAIFVPGWRVLFQKCNLWWNVLTVCGRIMQRGWGTRCDTPSRNITQNMPDYCSYLNKASHFCYWTLPSSGMRAVLYMSLYWLEHHDLPLMKLRWPFCSLLIIWQWCCFYIVQ
jgi:hypothetical protein